MRTTGRLIRGRWIVGGLWLVGLALLVAVIPTRPRLVVPDIGGFAGFTPDGLQFAIVPHSEPDGARAQDGGASLWDARTGQLADRLPGPWPADGLAFARDNRRAVALYSLPGESKRCKLMAWDRDADGRWSRPYIAEVGRVCNYFRSFLPDNRTVLLSGKDQLMFWDPPGRPPQPLNPGPSRPGWMALNWAINPDASRLAVEWHPSQNWGWPVVAVYEAATGRELAAYEPIERSERPPTNGGQPQVGITKLEFAPDGRTLAVTGQANWGLNKPKGQLDRSFISVWDVGAARSAARLVSHVGAAFTADGRGLVTVRQTFTDDELTVYDLDTGSERLVASYPRSISWGGGTQPDSWYALRRDWVVWPTRLSDGRILAVRTNDPAPDGISDRLAVWSSRFLKRLVEPRLDIRLIDALTGSELARLHCGNTFVGVFAPDGSALAIPQGPYSMPGAGPGGPAASEVWDVPPRQPLTWLAGGTIGWSCLLLGGAALVRRRRRSPFLLTTDVRPIGGHGSEETTQKSSG